MKTERKTCPLCNSEVRDGLCTNRDGCQYRGQGWSSEQRTDAWARYGGVEERTVGAQYDYTGRE